MTSRFSRLRLQQMDSVFDALRECLAPHKTPKSGWIRAVRESLGMSSGQLAKKLGVTYPSVLLMEDRESEGRITLVTLRKAADALGCDLHYAIMPRVSLGQMIRTQAEVVVMRRLGSVAHTMAMEEQPVSKEALKSSLDEQVSEMTARPPRNLWT